MKGRPKGLSPSRLGLALGLVIPPDRQVGKPESGGERGGARGRGALAPAMLHPAGISRCAADGFVSPRALSGDAFGGDAQGVFHAGGQAGDRLAAFAVHRHLHPGRRGVVVRAGFHGVELGTVDRLAADLVLRCFCYCFAFWGDISCRSPPTD